MSKRKSELAHMKYFWRVLKMVKPHLRYVFIAFIATIGLSLCYTFSIAALYPVLKVIVEKKSIHDLANRVVAEQRMDIELTVRDARGLLIGNKLGYNVVQVVRIDEKHELYKEGVRSGDFLGRIDSTDAKGWKLIKFLADTDRDVLQITIYPAGGGKQLNVSARVHDLKWYTRAMKKAAEYIPEEKGETVEELAHGRMIMLAYILGGLIALTIIGNFCRFLSQFYGSVIGARVLLDLRRRMYAKVMVLPMSFFVTNGISTTMSKFTQDSQDVLKALRFLFGKVMREPLKAVGAFSVLLVFAPKLTLILLGITPIAAILFRKFGKWIRKANEKLLRGYGKLLGALESTLSGIKVVKAYTMEKREQIHYFRVEREILRQSLKIEKVNAISSPVLEILGIFAISGAVMWVTSQVMHEKLDSAEIGTLLFAMGAILDPVRKLSNVYSAIQKANAGARRIFDLIDTPDEYSSATGTKILMPPSSNIRFEGVTFTYPNSEYPAVDNINLTINAGELVAIVGPNGSGKTTLVSLLLRLFDPQSGKILWDNLDINEAKLRSLRQQISFVSQETVIFADSIKNNIAYGNPNASTEQIIEASRQAHADEFIDRLPEKYDTVLGEHGITLSGGERQRIAIARAVLRDAGVIIFDEATSQIDADSEHKIQDAMNHFMPGRTALVIAHRFSTINKADKIIVMDRGQIVAQGTHQQLMKSSTLYKTLYQTQLEGLDKT